MKCGKRDKEGGLGAAETQIGQKRTQTAKQNLQRTARLLMQRGHKRTNPLPLNGRRKERKIVPRTADLLARFYALMLEEQRSRSLSAKNR